MIISGKFVNDVGGVPFARKFGQRNWNTGKAEMATSKEAPQQYKQPSRKGKKAWRKNVDVSEIQVGLEAVRDEVIQGFVERCE